MAYQSIENHGIVGDMHTAALVGVDGSVDWLCLPDFDSPSVFAAILDDSKGGRFQIAPKTENVTPKQLYWPDTNILVTRFLCTSGVGELTDYMPIGESERWHGEHQLIRRVTVVRGSMAFRVECRPAFNYARDKHEVRLSEDGACFHSSSLALGLATEAPLREDGQGGVAADFTLQEGEAVTFLLQQIPKGTHCGSPLKEKEANALFEGTARYWRRWLAKCDYTGRWVEMVRRSALVLKLLTHEPTGAIVASPTSSLPEHIGGSRNWDYRYTWIRDAAFTLYALMRIGFTEEASRFMQWIEARCHELNPDGSLQIMYGINGRHDLDEEVLDHLEGYKGSRPVRIGNGAFQQHQLDIYGELMDSIYLFNKYGSPISYKLWKDVRELMRWVCNHWRNNDCGIWEVRGGPRQFVYSKLMCWVAVDRGLRLADKRSFPADRDLWSKTRDAIYEEVMSKGWDSKRKAFVQYYGSNSLDASNLMMPLVFFLSPTDPMMLQTLDAITHTPARGGLVSNSLVYRYNTQGEVDGLSGNEGSFNTCTFWLVEALTRAGRTDRRRLEHAWLIFEKMLGYANHLGLFAEETGPCGEALGNFPQALTHLSLISAAYNLDKALGADESDWPGLAPSK